MDIFHRLFCLTDKNRTSSITACFENGLNEEGCLAVMLSFEMLQGFLARLSGFRG